MTIDEVIKKLDDASERYNLDPDTYGGSEAEYQHALGKSEAFSDAAYLVRELKKEER